MAVVVPGVSGCGIGNVMIDVATVLKDPEAEAVARYEGVRR